MNTQALTCTITAGKTLLTHIVFLAPQAREIAPLGAGNSTTADDKNGGPHVNAA